MSHQQLVTLRFMRFHFNNGGRAVIHRTRTGAYCVFVYLLIDFGQKWPCLYWWMDLPVFYVSYRLIIRLTGLTLRFLRLRFLRLSEFRRNWLFSLFGFEFLHGVREYGCSLRHSSVLDKSRRCGGRTTFTIPDTGTGSVSNSSATLHLSDQRIFDWLE
jgi:hypothetical protein